MEKVFNDIIEYRKKNNKTLRESSLKMYKGYFKKIIKLMKGDDFIFKSLDMFNDYNKVFLLIKSFTLSSQKNIINIIMVSLLDTKKYKNLKNIYFKYKSELEKKIKIEKKKQHKTKKEKKKWVTVKKLIRALNINKKKFNVFDKLIKKHIKNGKIIKIKKEKEDYDNPNIIILTNQQEDIILYYTVSILYILDMFVHGPRRNIYATFNIITEDVFNKLENKKTINALIISKENKKRFQFAYYKTSENMGAYIIELTNKMNNAFNKVLPYLLLYNGKKFNINWRDAQFNIPLINHNITVGNAMRKKANSSNLSKIIPLVFKSTGKQVTSTTIRKVIITKFYEKIRTLEEKKTFALSCGHSYTTAENIYNKMCG